MYGLWWPHQDRLLLKHPGKDKKPLRRISYQSAEDTRTLLADMFPGLIVPLPFVEQPGVH